MASLAFDTLKFAKRLKQSGLTEEQAEAFTDALKEVQQSGLADLATKQDLKELELRLSGEISLLKWMMGFVLAGIVSLILKAFFIQVSPEELREGYAMTRIPTTRKVEETPPKVALHPCTTSATRKPTRSDS